MISAWPFPKILDHGCGRCSQFHWAHMSSMCHNCVLVADTVAVSNSLPCAVWQYARGICGNPRTLSAVQGDWSFSLRAKGFAATVPDSEAGGLGGTQGANGERMFGSASERGCRMARGAGSCRRMDPGLLVLGSYTPVGSCIHWHHTHCDGLFWTHRARAIQGSCIDMLCAPPSWFLGVGPGTLPAMPACSG